MNQAESPAGGGDQDAGCGAQFTASDGDLAAVMHNLARGQQRLAEPRRTHEVDVELRRDGVLIRATQRLSGGGELTSEKFDLPHQQKTPPGHGPDGECSDSRFERPILDIRSERTVTSL